VTSILPVFAAAWRCTWKPAVLVPSAAATIGSALAFRALDAEHGFWVLPQRTMAWLALVVIARFWLGLCVTATVLAILRANGRWRPTQWVAPAIAFEVGFVAICLAVPILAALLFFIVPGVWLAIRWSQAVFLLLDRRAAWFESAEASGLVVQDRYLRVLAVWLIVGAANYALQAAEPFAPAALVWGVRVFADTYNLAVLAALYHALEGA
jgi:hypothetical protein